MTIFIRRTAVGWEAEYTSPGAEDIRQLFGTRRLPTAFTAEASAELVRATLERSHPGHRVEVAS